jgi:hypothetical protein
MTDLFKYLTAKPVLIGISLLLLLLNFITSDINPTLAFDKKEKFDAGLSYINSINKLEAHTDSLAAAQYIQTTSIQYVELLESIISKRFYHGFSHFSLDENWIAAISGRYIKEDCACKVQPEKIMQHANAACSQQALVMMQVLRNKNISYRSVGFPHHYAMEVLIDNNWYFFDSNMEPTISKTERMLANWNHENDKLKKYYDTNRFSDLDFKFGMGLSATTGPINEVPAPNASLVQAISNILSKIAWCFPLLLLFYRSQFSIRRPFASLSFRRTQPPFKFSV